VSCLQAKETPILNAAVETKDRIFDAARELFALRGFGAVSMRDIADKAGVKTSSIYYYYDKKDKLIQDILSSFQEEYLASFERVSSSAMEANSLEEFMDCMFDKDLVEMFSSRACLSMSLAIREQHSNAYARKFVFDLLYKNSIMLLESHFHMLTTKNLASQTNTKTLATLFMFCVMAASDLRVHEYIGEAPPVDYHEIYAGFKKIIAAVLIQDPSQ